MSPSKSRKTLAIGTAFILALIAAFTALPARAQQSENEQQVWKLESAYWQYVKAVDIDNYRALWHPNFVGWPDWSSQPAHKDHITDWIASVSDKGGRMQWYSLQPAASQATENVVVTHYWITYFWADKDGHGAPSTSRITHMDQDADRMADHQRHVRGHASAINSAGS